MQVSMTPQKTERPLGPLIRRHLGQGLSYFLLMVLAIVFLFPLVWMFISAFKPGPDIATKPLSPELSSFSWANFRSMLEAVPLATGFKNTLIVLIFKGALTLFFCPLAGFAFAKFRFKGRNLLFTLTLATLMLPPIVLLIPLLLEMGALGWVDTYQALILPGAIGAFAIFWMRQQIAEVPNELLDAGRIDGCSSFGLYWRIVVPIIRPSLAALGILTFLDIYNDFVWPVVVTNSSEMQTLQVMLSNLYNLIANDQLSAIGPNAWGEVLAASAIATLPVLVLFLILQRQFIRGIVAGSVKN